ncbi:MAG TPA: LysM peptidoglycan-binding domain-containing protein, partial [Stenomitos sp.]
MVRAADSTGGARPPVQTSPAQAAPTRPESIIAAGLGETPAAQPATPKPTTDTRSALPETVTVKKGDSLSVIAARNQVSLEQIKAHNPELFQDGTDASGKKRATDGRLIYPGDTIKLRAPDAKPIDPARTTTASNKVVLAAKEYIDNATILAPEAAGGKGKEVSQRVVDSARKMLALIPESDTDRKTYERKVDQIFANYLAQYPSTAPNEQQHFQDASNSFNSALRAYQDSKKVAKQLPAEDVRAFQIDCMQRALDAFTEANSSVRSMPEGNDQTDAKQQLDMMEYALNQMGVPDTLIQSAKEKRTAVPLDLPNTDTSGAEEVALNTQPRGAEAILSGVEVAAGGETGTQQAIGALPGTATTPTIDQATIQPTAQPAAAGTPQPIGTIGQQPGTAPAGYAPAVQPMPGYPVDPNGQPLYPVGANGQPLYPVGPNGQPMVPVGPNGQPIYPVGPNGQPMVPVGPNGQPMYPAGYAPAVQMPAAQPTGPRQYVPGPGEMAMFQAEDVKPTSGNYGNGGIERPNSNTGANGSNG